MKSSPLHLFQRHGLTMLIGALIVGSLAVIGYETEWGTNIRPHSAPVLGQVAKSGDTSLLPAFGLPAMDEGFKQTVDRPLFLPTRRPVPVLVGAVQPSMKKGQFRLAGTVVNRDLPYAFLVEIATGKGMRVAMGTEIISTGISVASVDAVRVVLKQGDETEELTLRTASSPRPPVALPGVPGVAVPGPIQRPPTAGVVVGPIPVAPAAPVPADQVPTGPRPGLSVMPGWVQPTPSVTPNVAPVTPAETAAGNQRRRRNPNVAPQ